MKQSVGSIITNSQGKYLLQMRDGAEGICNPLKWNFFGGGLEDGEDPVAGAVRENGEEIGLAADAADFEFLGEFSPKENSVVYVVRYMKPVEWENVRLGEGAGAGYFTKEEMEKIDITEATKQLIDKYL